MREVHGRDGWGPGRLPACLPAPVGKVIFGCPLLLQLEHESADGGGENQ